MRDELKPKWPTAKLVLGIVSLAFMFIVFFQSCTVGVITSINQSDDVSGSAGFLVAINMMITGIIAVAARNSGKKTPWIICTVLLWLNYFYAKMLAGDYKDLIVWGFLSFALGVFYLLSAMQSKKGVLIAITVSLIYLIIALI